MKAVMRISTDNEAFGGGYSQETEEPTPECRRELARILREVAEKLERGDFPGALFDNNGARCGQFYWSEFCT